MLDSEELKRALEMKAQDMGIRAIARSLGRDRKTIRNALGLGSSSSRSSSSKLDPFRDRVRKKVEKGLKGPRILREIRDQGYTGKRTILNEFIRTIRGPRKRNRRVVRRFETGKAVEAQVDWSPYRIPIAGTIVTIHCFSMILAYSRMMFVAFYRNERLPTLLHAHIEALAYFGGMTQRIIYDNMATVTAGRIGKKPIWNPTFLEFAKHYGFEPRTCRPKDPDRKGKVERPFPYIESDFLKDATFTSWEDLGTRVRHWLDHVANVRKHSTTGRPPIEMFAEEKPLLIELPAIPYATDRVEVRKVGIDGSVAIDASMYPVPAHLVGQYVRVRVNPHRIEVLDGAGEVAASHAIPDRPMRLPSAADWTSRDPEPPSRSVLEAQFLGRFPDAAGFLDGLFRRMKGLLPVHLRRIESLVALYGEANVRLAIRRAQKYGNYNANAIQRILEESHPDVLPEPISLSPNPASLGALDDIESATPEDYDLDTRQCSPGGSDDQPQE